MQLYYAAYGEGYPLLILHGLFGSQENWQTLSRQFARCYRVLVLDPHFRDKLCSHGGGRPRGEVEYV